MNTRHCALLLLAAMFLAGLSPALAADPWEFESEAGLASARSEFKSQTTMRVYEKAQELIKKGGPQSYQDAVRRLRWCVSREPDSGRRRDKIRRWKKIDYYPYYHLALIFAWQGDWNSSLRAIQREDIPNIEKSAFSVGYQRFMEDLDKVVARTRLVHMVDELLRWNTEGTPLSIDAAHGETLVLSREKAAALAEKPAGPWRGGHDAEAAALAQEVGNSLLTVYRLELGARRRAIEELAAPPWPGLLGSSTPIPSPASCEYAGNDLKHARDRLLRCAELTRDVLRQAASKACERAGRKAPAWCNSPSPPPWHEIAGLAGRPAPSAVAARRPTREPKARRKPEKKDPVIETPAESRPLPPPPPPVDEPPALEAPGAEALADAVIPLKEPLAARPLLRRIVRQLEEGGVDRVIEQLREVESDGVFPRSGRAAALCRVTFAYALHLKYSSFPETSDEASRRARGYLQAEIDVQLQASRRIDPGFVVPAGLFPGFMIPNPGGPQGALR